MNIYGQLRQCCRLGRNPPPPRQTMAAPASVVKYGIFSDAAEYSGECFRNDTINNILLNMKIVDGLFAGEKGSRGVS